MVRGITLSMTEIDESDFTKKVEVGAKSPPIREHSGEHTSKQDGYHWWWTLDIGNCFGSIFIQATSDGCRLIVGC